MCCLLLVVQLFFALIVAITNSDATMTMCLNELSYVLYALVPPFTILLHALFLKYMEKSLSKTGTLHGCTYGIILAVMSVAIVVTGLSKSWSCSQVLVRLVFLTAMVVTLLWTSLWCTVFFQNFIRGADDNVKRDLLSMVRCGCFSTTAKKTVLVSPYLLSAIYVITLQAVTW